MDKIKVDAEINRMVTMLSYKHLKIAENIYNLKKEHREIIDDLNRVHKEALGALKREAQEAVEVTGTLIKLMEANL